MRTDKDLLLKDILDLFSFEIKHSKRHGLDFVKITVPRATLLCNHIRQQEKQTKAPRCPTWA